MTIAKVPAGARAAVRARRRKEMGEVDYRRELRRLEQQGYSQRDMSKWLGIAQPSVFSALRTAAKVPMPLDGFSSATPYEICQRYAGGLITRRQLVDELTRFPYVKGGQTDGFDSLIVDPAGTWSEVDDAARRGLIEDDVYDEVFNRRHSITEPATEQEATPRKMPAKDLARNTAQEIATALGGGKVTELNGRIVIKTKDGIQIELKTSRDGAAGKKRSSRTGKLSSVSRVRAGKTVKVSGSKAAGRARLARRPERGF